MRTIVLVCDVDVVEQLQRVLRAQQRVGERLVRIVQERAQRVRALVRRRARRILVWMVQALELEKLVAQVAHVDVEW